MNDRYLYRAKRTDNGEWVEGTILHKSSSFSVECDEYYIFDGIETSSNDDLYLVDPSTICQCTGLKDKNGKLIWENDIVWDSEERKFYQIIFSQEDMCYYAQDADGYKHTFESCYGSSIEVESNIFDNPELLEVGE